MRSRFRAWHLAPLFALIALIAWAFASPVASSPDDDFHLASIWCAMGDHTSNCQPGTTSAERRVPVGIVRADCFARHPDKTAACQLSALHAAQTPTVETDRGSFSNNYPPVYYAVMGLLAGPDIEVSVLLMRLLNIVLLIGITVALGALLPAARRKVLVVAWLTTMVPLGVFLIASTNPSSWALIGIGSAWLALLGYFETTGRRRIALGAIFAVAGVMAAGSRGDAAIYLVMSIAIVLFLTFRAERGYLLRAILPGVLVVVALVFFLTSQQSGIAQSGLGRVPGSDDVPIDPLTLAVKDFLNVPSLWFGAFGGWGLGWLDTALPGVVLVGSASAFLLVTALGLRLMSRRKALTIAALFAVLWLLPTYILVRGGNQVGENVQPRYLLPLMVLLAGVILLEGRDARPVELARWPVVVAACGIGIANAIALYFNMRRYILGQSGAGASLDGRGTWWWDIAISPMTVWVVGSVAFGAMLVVLVREVQRRHELVVA